MSRLELPATARQGYLLWRQCNHPAPPASPADPLAARIAELVAAGWAPWNAEARARSEALEARQAGGAV